MNTTTVISQTGTGPIEAFDIAAIPPALAQRIVRGDITADEGNPDADHALDELLAAVNATDALAKPVVPGADLFDGLRPTYAVVRDGCEVQVPLEQMTRLEVEATASRLRMEAHGQLRHAEALGQDVLGMPAKVGAA